MALGAAILLTILSTTWAAAPTNDVCTGAEFIPAVDLTPHLTAITDIREAGIAGDPPRPPDSCVTFVSGSVWYVFTPSATATYSICSCADEAPGTTVPDTTMAIYTSSGGCGGSFSEITCNEDSCGTQAAISTQLNAGTTYYIVVWMYAVTAPTTGNSTVQLLVAKTVPPPNDTCATPAPLMLNTPIQGKTRGANNDYQLAGDSCFTSGLPQTSSTASGPDVVYSFTAPASGRYSFKVSNYNTPDLVVYVAASCPIGTPPITVMDCLVAANRHMLGITEEIFCVPLASNQTVYVFVDDDVTNIGTSFTIEATLCDWEMEPNNSITNAASWVCGLEGSIQVANDVDYYALGSPVVDSRVFCLVDGSAGKFTDFDLRVTTTTTNVIEYDDADNVTAFGDLSPNLSGTPLNGSPAFLRVNYGTSGTIEPYRLYAVVQPPLALATPEAEPNGALAQANAALNNYFSGALAGPAPSTDLDTYSFSAQQGDLILVGLDGDPLRDNTPINAQLCLFDASGTLLLKADNNNSSSSTNASTSMSSKNPHSPGQAMLYRARTNGTLYAQVAINAENVSTNTIGAGDYLLSISRNCVLGSLGVQAEPQFVSITHLDNDHILLCLEGTPGGSYQIQFSENLQTWSSLTIRTADANGLVKFTNDISAAPDVRFYRATWP